MSPEPAPRLVVGIGTGRCGTHSLAHLLGLQPGTVALHQPPPCLPWHPDPGWYRQAAALVRSQGSPVVALVAWYYLPYLDRLLGDFDARVVGLRRDREATVASILRLTPEFDHWSNRPPEESAHTRWRHLFPSYDVDDKAEALRRYHDEYYERAASWERRAPDRVRVLPTEALNSAAGVDELLDAAGYGSERRVEVAIRRGELEPYRWRGD